MPILSRRQAMFGGVAFSLVLAARHATFAQTAPNGPFTLPPLPYAPDANEPHIDAQTMQIHHDKHHAAYVANLNSAVKDYPQVAAMGLSGMLGKLGELPDTIRTAVRNNAGGHANHSMFWLVMGVATVFAAARFRRRMLRQWQLVQAQYQQWYWPTGHSQH